MEDKLQHFIEENEFDIYEPRLGHESRFQLRLQKKGMNRLVSLKWLSLAASITLVLGILIGNNFTLTTDKQIAGTNFNQVENYFITTTNLEINELERARNLETEDVIEEALDRIEELEEEYKIYLNNLGADVSKIEVIRTLTANYQKRLEILEEALNLIDKIRNPEIIESETYI